ncbi:GreA/GreB family elongation factor [Candidatus Parcubacteria bacterium]|nr:GreA/GreB family elongation factor [Candidatus Parcubacteria bacterium]
MSKVEQVYLTEDGLKKLKREHDELVGVRRGEVAAKIRTALDEGGADDNLAYDVVRDEQLQLERRVAELEGTLNRAVLIEGGGEKGVVRVGSTVVVEVEGERDEFTIVGSLEADPMKGLISYESPVGSALLGVKVGVAITVSSTVVTIYKVLEIR